LGKLDPIAAIDIVEVELLLADFQQCQKVLEKVEGSAKSGDKKAMEKMVLLERLMKGFNEGKAARFQDVPLEAIEEYQFLTAKPILYVANVSEGDLNPKVIESLKEKTKKENAAVVVLCAKLEAEIVQLPPEERTQYYESTGITTSGLTMLARTGQRLLNLICFFTANPNETRAWLISKGTKALKAAGKIHSDMERGFLRAEVYRFDDLTKLGSYKVIQERGLLRSEGKEYEIQDGDVVYFRFNV
jgi:GTP-binding protein YchF